MLPLPTLPPIAVLPHRLVAGINSLRDSHRPLKALDWAEAFSSPFQTDGHFVAYRPSDTEGLTGWPRINKPALSQIRAAGHDLLTTMLVLDYDNPGHQPWRDREQVGKFLRLLSDVADDWGMAWDWSLFYTTRNGARIVYVLDQPIPVDKAEGKHQWLCNEFNRRGIEVDLTTSDWTRIFRLPMVMREGSATWEEETFEIIEQLDKRLAGQDVPSEAKDRTRPNLYAELKPYSAPKPEDTSARQGLELMLAGKIRPSAFFKEAKRRLAGRESYDIAFNHVSLASRGERDNTIHRIVGQAIGLLWNVEGSRPEAIYALFMDAVFDLEPDAQTPDWSEVLWSAVCRLWSKEEAQHRAEQLVEQKKQDETRSLMQRVMDGMKEWSAEPSLHAGGPEAEAYVSRRLIASINNDFFIMQPNGYYETLPLNGNQVIPRVRVLGMDDLIRTRMMLDNGSIRDAALSSVLNDHLVVAKRIRAMPCLKGGQIRMDDKQTPIFEIPCYSRNQNLEPTYCKEVDDWLKEFFGPENYSEGIQWIAWSLAFDEDAIAALSITGPQGVGKKLFVQGLAECLSAPALADGNDLISEFNYGLLTSPFLCINEGWPMKSVSGRHPADQFRALVTGDPFMVNEKFKSPIEVHSPVRVVFTANNLEVVRKLFHNRELSPEERDALAIRLLHYHLDDRASAWLRVRGGMRFTGKEGWRWVRGDAGQTSDFVVAKHFLWLYSNRGARPGNRLLVEGNGKSELMTMMRTQSGVAPLVIETLIRMVESSVSRPGLTIENNELFVMAAEVVTFFRTQMREGSGDKLSIKQVNDVFRGLTTVETENRMLSTRREVGRRRWHQIDVDLLWSVAQRDGWTATKLEALVEKRHTEKEQPNEVAS